MIATRSLAPGSRSLPAELRARAHGWYGTPEFARARLNENLEQSQSRGGVIPPGLQRQFMNSGMNGLGDSCLDSATPGMEYLCYQTGPAPIVVPANDPGFNWGGLTAVINASSTDIAKILAASNPGTMYRDPQGNVIYSQPVGNTQNLPIGGGGPSGTFTSPIGSGSFSGISSSTILLIGLAGMMFIMMGSRR